MAITFKLENKWAHILEGDEVRGCDEASRSDVRGCEEGKNNSLTKNLLMYIWRIRGPCPACLVCPGLAWLCWPGPPGPFPRPGRGCLALPGLAWLACFPGLPALAGRPSARPARPPGLFWAVLPGLLPALAPRCSPGAGGCSWLSCPALLSGPALPRRWLALRILAGPACVACFFSRISTPSQISKSEIDSPSWCYCLMFQ